MRSPEGMSCPQPNSLTRNSASIFGYAFAMSQVMALEPASSSASQSRMMSRLSGVPESFSSTRDWTPKSVSMFGYAFAMSQGMALEPASSSASQSRMMSRLSGVPESFSSTSTASSAASSDLMS